MLVSSVALIVAGILLVTDVRGLASNHSSTLNATSSMSRSHARNATTTIAHSSPTSTSDHSAYSPTQVPSTFSGNATGNLQTGTIVTITTVLVTSLSPIPTDGPMLSAPYTPPLPGNRNSTRSPTVRGVGAWASPVQRARQVVAGLTLEERVNLTTGTGWALGHCVGNIGPIDRIGFPGLCLEDSPLGVRDADHVTAFPAGINAAATWDRGYMRHRGRAMGAEFRGKGAHIQLGPMMNMGRNAAGGRNWEGFGADPYLAGEAAYETVVGIQSQGVQACAKHYIGNEQEHNRTTSSSNIDDKTFHEVYLHPFLRAVAADIASIMCSYNLINGTWSCENENSLSDILKGELGFQGFVMSDWGATHSTLGAEAGLDMTMPGDINLGYGDSYFGPNLTDYINNGTISDIRLNDMVTRILAAYYLTKQDEDFPLTNFDAFLRNDSFNQHVVVTNADHQQIAYDIGVASTILLKNVNNALPLKKPKTLALIGSDCEPPPYGPNFYSDRGGDSGTLAMGWGSGSCDFPYLISPLEAIQGRGRKDFTSVSWFTDDWDLDNAGYAAAYKDVAIVFVNSDSGEGYIIIDGNEGDRNNLTAWNNGDALIQTVAGNNSNTMVVIHSVGPLILEPWIDHPNITAVVWAGLPGQESGNALRDVLYGDANPSGKLPYTIAKNVSDYSGSIITDSDPLSIKQVPYTERLLIDYRHFDTYDIEPRYEFGFGLSYTTFKYSNLNIKMMTYGDEGYLEAAWAKGNVAKHSIGSSLDTWLHRPVWNATFDVTNTGSMPGADVSQLYLEFPRSAENPPSVLRGFERTFLRAGQTSRVIMTLSRYDLSVWNSVQQGWSRPSGTIGVHIGASSRDFRLSGTVA